MIGPRPTRDRGGPRGGRAQPEPGHTASRSRRASPPPRQRSRSRSVAARCAGRGGEKKEKKEFAWMDSGDESDGSVGAKSEASAKSSSSSSSAKPVPLDRIETLGQMARQAPALERRLKRGEVRKYELVEAAAALARSKFFDPGLFGPLTSELSRCFKRGSLGTKDVLTAICSLAELNAYDAPMFEVACDCLRDELGRLADADLKRLESALKQVNHNPGESFSKKLRGTRQGGGSGREACPMFWRGQCKWGPKCKLSHDQEDFEETAKEGSWRPPTASGGKSVGFKQSSDLFKADRCGALW